MHIDLISSHNLIWFLSLCCYQSSVSLKFRCDRCKVYCDDVSPALGHIRERTHRKKAKVRSRDERIRLRHQCLSFRVEVRLVFTGAAEADAAVEHPSSGKSPVSFAQLSTGRCGR